MLFAVLSFATNAEKITTLEIEETVLIEASDLCSITEAAIPTSMAIPAAPEGVESQEAWCWGWCWWCCRTCITIDGVTYCTEWVCCPDDNDK